MSIKKKYLTLNEANRLILQIKEEQRYVVVLSSGNNNNSDNINIPVKERGLVLQGGGSLGAYAAGAYKALYELLSKKEQSSVLLSS